MFLENTVATGINSDFEETETNFEFELEELPEDIDCEYQIDYKSNNKSELKPDNEIVILQLDHDNKEYSTKLKPIENSVRSLSKAHNTDLISESLGHTQTTKNTGNTTNSENIKNMSMNYESCLEQIRILEEEQQKTRKIQKPRVTELATHKSFEIETPENLESLMHSENDESLENTKNLQPHEINPSVLSVITKIREISGSTIESLIKYFQQQGLNIKQDIRLTQLNRAIETLLEQPVITCQSVLTDEQFFFLIIQNIDLVNQVVSRQLTVPDFQGFAGKIHSILEGVKRDNNKEDLSVTICTVDGQSWNSCEESSENSVFPLNTAIRPIIYGLALSLKGSDFVHSYVGQEPKPHGLSQKAMKLDDHKKPFNPLVSTGAILTATLVKPELSTSGRQQWLDTTLAEFCNGEMCQINTENYEREKIIEDSYYACMHYLRENDCYPKVVDDVRKVSEEGLDFEFYSASYSAFQKSNSKYSKPSFFTTLLNAFS